MGEWSPSHLIVAGLALATIIGQAIAVLSRLKTITERLEKQIEKQGETFFHALERLEERMDKRFVEVNQQIVGLRSEMTQGFSGVRSEMNQRLSDMNAEMSKLNQNHIEHLNRHHSE